MTELQVTINNLKEVIIAADLVLEKLEKAKKDLETPPQHKWEHGDIFRADIGSIMMYLGFTYDDPQLVCVGGLCEGLVEKKYFNEVLREGKFLFNIKEKL